MIIKKIVSIILISTMFIETSIVGPVFAEEKMEIQQDIPQVVPIVEVVDEPEEMVEIVEEPEDEALPLTDEEIDLIALVTMAEAEGESIKGKRLVIDVILNRLDSKRFPNTVNGVIYAKNQFECMTNGRVNRCHVRDDIRDLVIEELQSRTQSDIYYFRTNHYHRFGKPVLNEGNHYFSTY